MLAISPVLLTKLSSTPSVYSRVPSSLPGAILRMCTSTLVISSSGAEDDELDDEDELDREDELGREDELELEELGELDCGEGEPDDEVDGAYHAISSS